MRPARPCVSFFSSPGWNFLFPEAPGNVGSDFRCSLRDIFIHVPAREHEFGSSYVGVHCDGGTRQFAAFSVGGELVEWLRLTMCKVIDCHHDLQVRLASSKTDNCAAKTVALIHLGEHPPDQQTLGWL